MIFMQIWHMSKKSIRCDVCVRHTIYLLYNARVHDSTVAPPHCPSYL